MHRRKSLFAILGLIGVPAVVVAQDDCKPLTDARRLPALTKLLDSAAVVASLPAADSSGPTEVLLSVMTGATPRAFVMDSVAARSAIGSVILERVLASLKPESRNALPAFRVRVVLAQALGVSVEPSVLCAPQGKGAPSRVAFTVVVPAGPGGSASRPRPRDVSPRIKIGVNGEVLQVDLGGGTGYADGDRAMRQSMESQRYEPARLDGRPVEVWLQKGRVDLVR